MTMTKEKVYNAKEAARELDLSLERVRQLIREGQLGAIKLKGWQISQSDIDAFRLSRRSRPLYEQE